MISRFKTNKGETTKGEDCTLFQDYSFYKIAQKAKLHYTIIYRGILTAIMTITGVSAYPKVDPMAYGKSGSSIVKLEQSDL